MIFLRKLIILISFNLVINYVFFFFFLQGAVSVRFQLHQTSLCFVCCHLASGGREGDEKNRNSNVGEIFSRTIFPKGPSLELPTKILDHEYVI